MSTVEDIDTETMVVVEVKTVEEFASNFHEYEVQLPYNPQGTLINSQDRIFENLAGKISLDHPLFNGVSSHAFRSCARKTLQPNFTHVPKKMLKRKIVAAYNECEQNLKDFFAGFDGRVVISCDLWSVVGGGEDVRYVCVICYWVREDWFLEKRVIGFELIYPYGHDEIVSRVLAVLDRFNLRHKVASMSFEDSCIREKYMGSLLGTGFNPGVLELFSHDRSYAHVVDLCAQLVVDQMALFIDPIRELVKWVRFSGDKMDEFRALCKNMGLRPRHIYLDCSKDWKPTYGFLCRVYPYRGVLSKLYSDNSSRGPMADSQWDAINSLLCLLQKFDAAADRFPRAYDAGCHLVILDSIKIVHALRTYENDPLFCSVVRNVRSKWLDHFPEFPTIYGIASILDPRVKAEGLANLLAFYYEALGVNYNVGEKIANCRSILHLLHAHYASIHKCETEMTSSLREGMDEHHLSSDSDFFTNIVKGKSVDGPEVSGDLCEYLVLKFAVPKIDEEEYFEILEWWNSKKEVFPVLSKIAKEILCIPTSTVIPKINHSPRRRVLDEKRSMLSPNLLRICICKADWDMAEEGTQGFDDEEEAEAWMSLDSDTDY